MGFFMALIISHAFSPILSTEATVASIGSLLPGETTRTSLSALLCLIPMLLLTAGAAGSQTLGIAGWELRSTRGGDFFRTLWRELLQGTIGGILTTVLVGLLSWFLFRSLLLSLAVGIAFGITLLIAALCGLALPNILQRLHLRGSLIAAPLLNPVIAIASLSIFLATSLALINGFLG